MKYHILHDNPEQPLQDKLEAFEQQFHYPLGEKHWFSISHGEQYLDFYLAMGPAVCVVAENEDGVQGTICAVTRQIVHPNNKHSQSIVYVGDLKVSPSYRGSSVSYRLMKCLTKCYQGQSMPVMCVVMDGTKATPEQYTGRAGLLALQATRKIHVIQLAAKKVAQNHETSDLSLEEGFKLFSALETEPYFKAYQIQKRCEEPYFWVSENQEACGLFENTRAAKKLYLENNKEIKNAHLSYISFKTPESAKRLLETVSHIAYEKRYEAVFLGLTEETHQQLSPVLSELPIKNKSLATVYATEDLNISRFQINTSEI